MNRKILPNVILIKSGLSKSGGLEKYTWKIAEQFCQKGVALTVLTTGNPLAPFSHPLLNIINFCIDKRLSVSKVIHFDQACHDYLQHHPANIVFSLDRNRFQTHHRAGNGVHAAYLQRRMQEESWLKKISFRLNPLHHTILRLEREAFENPRLKVLFTNSEMVKEEVLRHYKVASEKIQVVHNGVEWGEMQAPFDVWERERQEACMRLHLDPQSHQFLFLGHNYKRKGLEKLLNAFSLLPNEDFQLSVVGKEKSLRYFQDLVAQLNLSKKVFLFGPCPQVLGFYQLADTVVIPSLYDPFANVTVEALAMGVPVLSSAFNGGKEILTEDNGCVIPDLDDATEFAKILKERIDKRKTQASASMVRRSVKHLTFHNQLEKMIQMTL